MMRLTKISLLRQRVTDWSEYPFNIPAIGSLDNLEINSRVCFFVGENGTGKSTLLEATASHYGFGLEGGNRNFSPQTTASVKSINPLAGALRLSFTKKTGHGFYLRAESFFNVASHVDSLGALQSYGGKSLHDQSHGESFISLLQNRFTRSGFYLMDEPEAALSPQRQLSFLVLLHELVADNVTGLQDSAGERDPWVELYNGGATPIDLNGYYLANSFANLTQWAFPSGATISPGQFLLVWLDGQPEQSTPGELHANFRIAPFDGTVVLSKSSANQPLILDYIGYGEISADYSLGFYPDGVGRRKQIFYYTTPGGANNNTPAPLTVFINEWMAKNTQTIIDTADGKYHDWFELYNGGPVDADLSGYTLTDTLTNFAIPTGYTIPAGGYLLVWADNNPAANDTNDQALHVNFKLSAKGAAIGLLTPNRTVVDNVTFGAQTNDTSEGRWPDGNSGQFYFMPVPTPGSANTIAKSNSPPVLAPMRDLTVVEGSPLTFTATATDDDTGQTLTFSLDPGAPPGATINPSSGVFVWTPTGTQGPGVYPFTVRVIDNGFPPLSDTSTFSITVVSSAIFRVTGVTMDGNGNVMLTWDAEPGKTYRVLYKTDLNQQTWTPIVDIAATTSSLSVVDNTTGDAQRYYLIQMLTQ